MNRARFGPQGLKNPRFERHFSLMSVTVHQITDKLPSVFRFSELKNSRPYRHLLANSRYEQTREFGHFQNSRNISKLATPAQSTHLRRKNLRFSIRRFPSRRRRLKLPNSRYEQTREFSRSKLNISKLAIASLLINVCNLNLC